MRNMRCTYFWALLLAQAGAVSLVVYEFANCTGKQERIINLLSGTCTQTTAQTSAALMSCSSSNILLAQFYSPNCTQPMYDALYSVPTEDAGSCLPVPGSLSLSSSPRGMRVVSRTCTQSSLLVSLHYDSADCSRQASLVGLVPEPGNGGSACSNPLPSTQLSLSLTGYTPSSAPPSFTSATLWYDPDTASGNSTCNSGGGATEYGAATGPVPLGGCNALVLGGTASFFVHWARAGAFDPAAPGAVPVGIPTAALAPIRCFDGNKTSFTLQATPVDSLCMSASLICQPGLPSTGTEGLCSPSDVASRVAYPYRSSVGSASWAFLATYQAENCSVPARAGGCPLFKDVAWCAREGCNAPPAPPSSGAGGLQHATAALLACALAAVALLPRGDSWE